MTAKRAGTNCPEPLSVIDESQVFFDLSVAEIMPVTQVRRFHLLKELGQFALGWNLFIIAPCFQANPNIFPSRILDDAAQTILHALQTLVCNLFPLLDGADFHS